MSAKAKAVLPVSTRRWIRVQQRRFSCWPPVGWVQLGSLRRLEPISRHFGFDRGQSIDRYYIERFLSTHAQEIRGRVLEVADAGYTRQFGGDRVTKSDVLHVVAGNPQATIVADLTCPLALPVDTFDCIVLSQTLHVIYDVRTAIKTLFRGLRPGGVLLVTTPGISHISRYDMDRWGDYWRMTSPAARRLFEEVFPASNVTVEAHGNVLAAVAFLHGLASQDLRQRALDYRDPDYELVITIRALKPATAS